MLNLVSMWLLGARQLGAALIRGIAWGYWWLPPVISRCDGGVDSFCLWQISRGRMSVSLHSVFRFLLLLVAVFVRNATWLCATNPDHLDSMAASANRAVLGLVATLTTWPDQSLSLPSR
jgi:hypothetical protein